VDRRGTGGTTFHQDGRDRRAPAARRADAKFEHSGRVRLLRNAIGLARSCDHPALAALLNVIETPAGPMLACQAAPGELIGELSPAERADPASAYQRFASLPVAAQLPVFDTLIDLHRVLAGLGWVACDLYDGCLIVDFSTLTLHVVDLDTYRRGPGRNDTGRMFGSRRFMAPEEFELGAPLDQRTTVFTLGHLVRHFTTGLTEDTGCFDGPAGFAAVVAQAVEPAPEDRFPTVAAFASASLGASSRVTAAAWQPVSAGAVVFAAMAGHQRRGPAGAGQPVSVTSLMLMTLISAESTSGSKPSSASTAARTSLVVPICLTPFPGRMRPPRAAM
jgi:serine/threonine protein kinase, bacterial